MTQKKFDGTHDAGNSLENQADKNNTKTTAEPLTHFGFQEIPLHEKKQRVAEVFNAVTDQYDLMNDLMSFGLHRLWKKFTLQQSSLRPGLRILDVAGGTGDLAAGFLDQLKKLKSPHLTKESMVVLADINGNMLRRGRDRLADKGFAGNVFFVEADAECLPFPDQSFDRISIAFGLRNVTDKMKALRSMYRLLKPGGKILILEFSKPILPLLQKGYDFYSFQIIPKLGEWVCGKREEYQYLVESIRMHPDQVTLKDMMISAGFENVTWHNLTGGIVALHIGYAF